MSNFEFLRPHKDHLADIPRQAERYCHNDPNTALLKLSQFGEALALETGNRPLALDSASSSPMLEVDLRHTHEYAVVWQADAFDSGAFRGI